MVCKSEINNFPRVVEQDFLSVVSFFCRTTKTVLACEGFHGDVLTLTRVLNAQLKVRVINIFFIFGGGVLGWRGGGG